MDKFIVNDLKKVLEDIAKEAKLLEGKTILISGGSGFLGSYINVVFYLLNKNVLKNKCKVISIDNYITGAKKNFIIDIKDKNFTFIHGDVRLPINLNEKIDYIIHAAGLASPFYYKKYPLERINKVDSFLFFSSS